MNKNLWKFGVLGMAMMAFTGCESDEEMSSLSPTISNNLVADGSCDAINFDNTTTGNYISEVYSVKGMGPVLIHNKARNTDGELEDGNRAMIFDTGMPTGDDDDLYTDDWGKALIIQELGIEDEPNDNQWGGEMELTFPSAVTLQSINVLDIDTYEDNSWVYLYNDNEDELYKVKLQPIGDNSKQTVNLGNTAGVKKLKIVLAGNDGFVGSGAIDDIMLCETTETAPVDEVTGCTRTQGYWKNHADPKKKQYDATWDDYLGVDFYGMGDYLTVLKTAPKGGDADIILAHQFIAAELNVAAGASIPQDVLDAWLAAKLYFEGKTTATRNELLTWAELLDDYNNGVVGPGHCD